MVRWIGEGLLNAFSCKMRIRFQNTVNRTTGSHQLQINSTLIRVPLMHGFPPKMAGLDSIELKVVMTD